MWHMWIIFFSPGCGRACEECLLDMQVLPSKTKLQGGVSSDGGDAITNFKQHKSAIGWERGWSRGIKDGNRGRPGQNIQGITCSFLAASYIPLPHINQHNPTDVGETCQQVPTGDASKPRLGPHLPLEPDPQPWLASGRMPTGVVAPGETAQESSLT